MPWPRANAAPRSVGRVIGPPDRRCQRLMSTNRRIAPRFLHCAETPIFQGQTPYLSHNPAAFWHTWVLNRLMPVGAGGGGRPQGKGGDHHEPVAFFAWTDNFAEICTLFTFVRSGRLRLGSRISVRRAALPFPFLQGFAGSGTA